MWQISAEIIYTLIVIGAMILLRLLSRSAISRALRKFRFSDQRRRLTVRMINFMVALLGAIGISSIWGLNREDLLIFVSSVITVLGIAFFAQWSLLSNISAGLILFFNHPLKLGDHIKIHDREYPVEGTVLDIGYFFVRVETSDGEKLSIPNSILLQKVISVKEEQSPTQRSGNPQHSTSTK